ncbi:MAG TPA: hypothetical protein IAC36_06915 [Candidatus Aphodomonas merdavium]|nr:hypothetical protein [Candidatus Aphodomonas merdavium]
MSDLILVLGARSRSGRAAVQQLRAAHYYCRLLPEDVTAEVILQQHARGVLLTGALPEREGYDAIFSLGIPVLALGSGAEAALERYERAQEGGRRNEIALVHWLDCSLFEGVADGERNVCGARAYDIPPNLRVAAYAEDIPVAFVDDARRLYVLLVRVERNDPDSAQLLLNFAQKVCGCTPWWTEDVFIDSAVEQIRAFAGSNSVVCAMSGGVDSTVAGLIARRALGERAQCVFVNTGLMRDGEAEATERFFRDELQFRFTEVDISSSLLYTLRGLETMDAKWQIASREIEMAIQRAAAGIANVCAVVHGTDVSDVLDGGDLGAQREEGSLPVLEPLRELFKDEVRRVGEALGLPQSVLDKQSFPTIGLAARMSGEVTPAKLKILRAADSAFLEELRTSGQKKRLSCAYAMLDTVGDKCSIVLRALQGQGANAMAARLPSDLIERTVARIRSEIPQVRRVLYDFTPGSEG